MGWIHLDIVRQRHEPLERAMQIMRSVVATEIGAADVTDEKRITRQDHPWLVGARSIRYEKCDALGRVARCVPHAGNHVPERDLIPVDKWSKRVVYVGVCMHVDL